MVVIVMGVSGSGKTVVGQALAARLGWTFEDADQWHSAANVAKMHSGQALNDEDRAPWIEALNLSIRNWISEGRDVVLACSALRESYRKGLRAGINDAESMRFVYLRGTYDEIDQRLRQRRAHFMPESLLKSQFEALEEPRETEALAVNACSEVADIVKAVIVGLHLKAPQLPNMGTS